MILLSSLFLLMGFFSQAQMVEQNYKTAVGIKFYPAGLTVKHFVSDKAAVEGLLYSWTYGARLTALYEFHGNISDVEGLKWYAGPGAHLQFWKSIWKGAYGGVGLGIDGVVGLDYKFKDLPINLSVDWQPSYNITGWSHFEAGYGGVGIRYTF